MKTINFIIAAAAALAPFAASAQSYQTAGNNTIYTLNSLASIPESGVTKDNTLNGVYVIQGELTIAEGDAITFAGAETILMADGAHIIISGSPLLAGSQRTLLAPLDNEARPRGVTIDCNSDTEDIIHISGLDFSGAQLRNIGSKGFDISDCTFRYANGTLSSSGALAVGPAGASFGITDCTFEYNTVPAIGGAANYQCGLYIANCTFNDNNTDNTNKPQLNLTTGGDLTVTVKDCIITGAQRNMVGGIAFGNLTMAAGDNYVLCEGNTITDCRYGLTGVGPMTMRIADNTLIGNRYEDNPMNGGSGISLSGYGYGLDAVITGNHIEQSLWGITLIYTRDVNLGQEDNPDSPGLNVFIDNGFDGTPYDLYNNSWNTVYAQLNTWSVPEQTEEEIEKVIFHKADNPDLGEVIFMPPYKPAGIDSASLDNDFDTPMEIFDLQGRRIAPARDLNPGIYVVRRGNTVSKVLIRH